MRLLSRTIFRDIFVASLLGTVLFTFVLFLQRTRPLFELMVRSTGSFSSVACLFALVLPQSMPLTIPLGVLVGTLITLSRMSADGEITAMRAAGVPGRSVAPPIFLFSLLGMIACAAASLWLTPWSIREFYKVENQVIQHELTADIEPRVFEEQFPNTILYVSDITAGQAARLKRVFMADITPPDQRKPGAADRGDTPRITLASDAVAVPDIRENRITLALRNGTSYETDKENNYHVSGAPTGEQGLEAQRAQGVSNSHPSTEIDTVPLYREAYHNKTIDSDQRLSDRIELHQRLALPLACILLAMAGVPLGITSRRAGKSSAVVLTVVIAFVYYIGLIGCIGLARSGRLRPEIGLWIPDSVFAIFASVMIIRLEAPGDRDFVGRVLALFRGIAKTPHRTRQRVLDRIEPRAWLWRIPMLPQVVDAYVLATFLFYLVLWITSFVLIFHVFTFFELLSDIVKNHPPMSHVLSYHFFLTPLLVYNFTPVAVLGSVLVAFGVLSKHNEITAFKACGISVYRLAVPILIAGFFLSGGLFAFDHYWVPEADRRQDALRAEIRGKPPQTYLRPDHKWIYGKHDRVFYYKYFDAATDVMLDLNVYEIDPQYFRLKRHIWAERARWEPSLSAWVFQNGWSRDMDASCIACPPKRYDSFAGGTRVFHELEEDPHWFLQEEKQARQMNFEELKTYIAQLKQSGFNTIPLQVEWNEKFSQPLFALIMAIVAVPFAFLAGNRGAMAGVGLSLGVAIAYWSIGQLFSQIGNLNELPPAVAAWSPDVIFSLAGLYFLARMRT
ncbi:MAG TPA: LptF/LptG family permease [Bryobacteraceae bacterium]|jgi:LPS export ABC transporter permease LptF/LPS export ABC transporter permease LptG|nr:LptF/LptG family permease [Bryobacteraceae bacterium]